MDCFMSDVKNKTEETHLLLNTHAVKCNELLILCVFLIKEKYCSESLLQATKSMVIVVQKGKRNSRS